MGALATTPADRLVDARGRPYFLWDEDLTLDEFRQRLSDADPEVRAYYIGRLMRQAKPDDVFSFVSLGEIYRQLPALDRYLGRTRDFWHWLLERWRPPRFRLGHRRSRRRPRSSRRSTRGNENPRPDDPGGHPIRFS